MDIKFSELVLIYRKRSKLTQYQLAIKCGVNSTYILHIEKQLKSAPTFQVCMSMADSFKLSSEERYQFFVTAYKERTVKENGFVNVINEYRSNKIKGGSLYDLYNEECKKYIDLYNKSRINSDLKEPITQIVDILLKSSKQDINTAINILNGLKHSRNETHHETETTTQ